MSLFLTQIDARRFRSAAHVLAASAEFDGVDEWRAAATLSVRTLFAADSTLLLLPPCAVDKEPQASPASTPLGGPRVTPFYFSPDVDPGVVARMEGVMTATAQGRDDAADPFLAASLRVREAFRLPAFTVPQLVRLSRELPHDALDPHTSPFVREVVRPAGLWDSVHLAHGPAAQSAILTVATDSGRRARFTPDAGLLLAEMLQPAFAAGVRAALARWGLNRSAPMADPRAFSVAPPADSDVNLDGMDVFEDRAVQTGRTDPTAIRLTPRERAVASLLAARRTNAEIAAVLGLSRHTARHHTEHVLAKLGVRSRRDVARHVPTDAPPGTERDPA